MGFSRTAAVTWTCEAIQGVTETSDTRLINVLLQLMLFTFYR